MLSLPELLFDFNIDNGRSPWNKAKDGPLIRGCSGCFQSREIYSIGEDNKILCAACRESKGRYYILEYICNQDSFDCVAYVHTNAHRDAVIAVVMHHIGGSYTHWLERYNLGLISTSP